MTNHKYLAIITARGGSKGLPGKNLKPLHGKPLVAWTIEAAQSSYLIHDVILTTEDEVIATVGLEYNCRWHKRPQELSTDTASSVDVVMDVLEHCDASFTHLLLLQPTSPLRTTSDIDACINLAKASNAPCVISLCPVHHHPYLCFALDDNLHLNNLATNNSQLPLRRQDFPKAYAPNGALYLVDINWFKNKKVFIDEQTVGYIMPPERSIDIDDAYDFALAEFLMQRDRE